MPTTIRTVRDLAELVGTSKSTVDRWMKRGDWPFGKFPLSRQKVPDVLRWAIGAIRDRSDVDRRAPSSVSTPADDGGRVVDMLGDYEPVIVDADGVPLPVEQLPDLVVSAVERDVLAGRRTLTSAQAAELVQVSVRLRQLVVDACAWLPVHLAGHDAAAVARRMRSQFYSLVRWATETADGLAQVDEHSVARKSK
jgi:predicted DNA-binding transcriptional regulator AlpA